MAEEKQLSSKEIIEGFFDEIPAKEPIVVGIAGPPQHGKTHFINTFPNPVIGDTEGRAQIVMKKFKGGRHRKITKDMSTIRQTINVITKNLCPDETKRNEFTYALDSGSDWQQMAELEYLTEAKKDKVYPLVLWAKVYEKMDQVFDRVRQIGINMVITQTVKEIYKNEKPTGEFAAAGYKKIPYRVDVALLLKKGIEYNGEKYYEDHVVAVVDKDCWHRIEETKPYLLDVSYDGIFKELKEYKHPKPGDKDAAVKLILDEMAKRTGIPVEKAKSENKEA